jgi:hypothetical protein
MKPLTRTELLALPATTDLPTLGRAFGISEPVVRERHRLGEFDRMGIRVLRLGAKWRVVTADIWRVLGLTADEMSAVSRGTGSTTS